MKKIFVCLLTLCLLSSAFAADRKGGVTLSLGGGYDQFSTKRRIENTEFGFGILGYDFTKHWGLEGLLGFFNTRSTYPTNYNQQVKGTIFAIDGVYRFSPIHSFVPYVLAGPGVVGLNPNGNDANNEGNVNAGVGTLIFINRSLAFRVEARDFYTIVGGKNDVLLDGGLTILF